MLAFGKGAASNISLNLGPPNHDSITTVDGCLLKVIGRVMLPFAIGSKIFPFEAHVIQDLTSDVILGRNFFEKFCAKIDFDEGMIRFKHGEGPLPFDSDPVTIDKDCCPEFVCSMHADTAFTIPPQSEIIVLGRLNAELPLKRNCLRFSSATRRFASPLLNFWSVRACQGHRGWHSSS